MNRRSLLLSMMAGTAGALLAPRRALTDGFRWKTAMDSPPGRGTRPGVGTALHPESILDRVLIVMEEGKRDRSVLLRMVDPVTGGRLERQIYQDRDAREGERW